MRLTDLKTKMTDAKKGYRIHFVKPDGTKDQTPERDEKPIPTLPSAQKFAKLIATTEPGYKDITIIKGDTGLPVKGEPVLNPSAKPSSADNVA